MAWSSFVQHVDQRCPHHLACGAPCAPSGAARLMKVASCAHLLPCPALHTQYLSVHLSHHLHTPHHSSMLDVWGGALRTERRQATLFTVQTIWEQQARRVQCKQQFCWPDYPASPFSRLQIEIAQLTYRYKYIPFPNLKKYYGRQELYSQSHKIQYKKALLAQDWVLRWNFHLLSSRIIVLLENCKFQRSALNAIRALWGNQECIGGLI